MDDKSVSQSEAGLSISRDQTGPGCRESPGGCGSRREPRRVELPACSGYADLLVDLSDGELPPDQQEAVRDHVACCPGCRAELARLDASLVQLAQGIGMQKASGGCGVAIAEPRLIP